MSEPILRPFFIGLPTAEAGVCVVEPNGQPEEDGPEVFLPLAAVEKDHILRVYEALNRNKSRTARVLGVDVKTLYNKLKLYGVYSANEDRNA